MSKIKGGRRAFGLMCKCYKFTNTESSLDEIL